MMEETITFTPDQDGKAIKAVFRRNGQYLFAMGKEITDASPDGLRKAKLMLAHGCIIEGGGSPL